MWLLRARLLGTLLLPRLLTRCLADRRGLSWKRRMRTWLLLLLLGWGR
jgi:hypothetical protein